MPAFGSADMTAFLTASAAVFRSKKINSDPMKTPKNADWQETLPTALMLWQDGRKIEEVESIVPDLAGIARGKALPAKKFSLSTRSFLPVSIFYMSITGSYIEEHDEEGWLTESDMILRPDMETASAVPWAED